MFDVEKYFYNWIPEDSRLNPFYEGIHNFVEAHVSIDQIKICKTPKEILDPCVGYIKLKRWEIAIIDTHLFQRLRKITQLGLAYQVYPTLRYSRFEHTLGVLGRLNQSLVKLKEKHSVEKKFNIDIILNKYENLIRLAALFHDVGHCIFSHLSESVINELEGIPKGLQPYPSVALIKEIYKESSYFEGSSLTITEIFSVTILAHRKIGELLFKANFQAPVEKDENTIQNSDGLSDYILYAARFIAGLPVSGDPSTVFMAQLLSSGLDADKLDYMSREELFSGIKIEMDLVRIFNKIKLFYIEDKSNLPKELTRYYDAVGYSDKKGYVVLGIERGGQFSYEEFCVARLALYEKIYLHKKVRAAESYLQKKLELLVSKEPEFKKAHNWLSLVESIVERSQYTILEENISVQFDIFTNSVERKITPKIEVDLSDIEKRNIPFRAFAFGPANAKTDQNYRRIIEEAEFSGIDSINKLDSIRLWNQINPNRRFNIELESRVKEVTNLIIDETLLLLASVFTLKGKHGYVKTLQKIFEVNKKNDFEEIILELKALYAEVLKSKIIIDVPDYRRVQLKYGSLNFEESSYQTVRWTIPIDQIARYYQLHRILAYVYTERNLCPIILLACERVFYNYLSSSKLVFSQTQVIAQDILDDAKSLKRFICDNTSLYDDYADIKPLHGDLESPSAKEKISSVVEKLNTRRYFDNKFLTYLDVENFLRQFSDKLQLPALNLINSIKVLSTNEIESTISYIVTEEKEKDNNVQIGIIPLGSYYSSASNMMKSYKTFLQEQKIKTGFLQDEAIALEQDCIIFFDDNINTGIQAVNIIAHMLNVDSKKLEAKKILLKKITDGGEVETINNAKIIEHFRKVKLKFVFITGHESSTKNLIDYLVELCDIPRENISVTIKHILYDKDRIFSGVSKGSEDRPESIFREVKNEIIEKNLSDLKAFLERVGSAVVKSRSIVKTYKLEATNYSLGYCNRESLVIFPSSIPTMTITPLWCEGEFENKPWKALIPRPISKNEDQ